MLIRDVFSAAKSHIQIGEWQSGKMPKGKFRLSKAGKRAYAVGSAWRWCFVEFRVAEYNFVLRLLLSVNKARAYVHLASRDAVTNDCAVLLSLEYHPDHQTGWHVHTPCGSIEDAPLGTLVHGPWVKRLPNARAFHRRQSFYQDQPGGPEAWLLRKSLRFFHIEEGGPLL